MPSLIATIAGLTLIAQVSAHVSLINIYGSNGEIGHAFGVNLNGKYPRVKGLPGDAGGDAGVFQTGTPNPSPSCGSTPELGPLQTSAWLSQAEGFGLPAAYPNMSVVFEVFQVNRDGGGPMSCQYSEDATATSWKPMTMILNQSGNFGLQNQVRTNETVVTQFPEDAQCTGGWTGTACIVRCLTGVNKRFGGCFAVKLSGTTQAQVTTQPESGKSPAILREATSLASVSALSTAQIDSIAKRVLSEMKHQGLVAVAGASSQCTLTKAQGPAASLDVVHQVLAGSSGQTNGTPDAENKSTHGAAFNPTAPIYDAASDGPENSDDGVAASSPGQNATASTNATLSASDLDDLQTSNSTPIAIAQSTDTASKEPTTRAMDASDLEDLQTNNSSSLANAPSANTSSKKPASRCRARKNQSKRHAHH